MFLQERSEPKRLLIYRYLDRRMKLTNQEKSYLDSLEKGYQGEVKFDQLLRTLRIPCLIISDLQLEINQSTVQIDSYIITAAKHYLIDVKNMEGDYYVDAKGNWYTLSTNIPVKNPIQQVARMETLLSQFFRMNGITANVQPQIIFINPQFYLFQAPINTGLVFPTQLTHYINRLGANAKPMNQLQKNIAHQLLTSQVRENPYVKIPSYEYDSLKKGLCCVKCGSIKVEMLESIIFCQGCHHIENVVGSLLMAIHELHLLFPKLPLTTSLVADWCGGKIHSRLIRKVLDTHFQHHGSRPKYYIID